MEIISKDVGTSSEDMLIQEHQKNIELIARIKLEVAECPDNINNPIPFSSQLAAGR